MQEHVKNKNKIISVK